VPFPCLDSTAIGSLGQIAVSQQHPCGVTVYVRSLMSSDLVKRLKEKDVASTTVATGTPAPADVSTMESALRTLSEDQLQHLHEQISRVVVMLAPHRRELGLMGQALRRWAATRPPSPYEHMIEAFSEQAHDIRCSWEQVGLYLQRAMDDLETRPADGAHE